MTNPLLEQCELPPFTKITPEQVKPAVEQIISDSEAAIEKLLNETTSFSWSSLQEPMDSIGDRLSQSWSPVGHMNAVVNSDELRDAYNSCLPLLSEYSTKMGQNQKLYQAYFSLSESGEFNKLDSAQQKVIEDNLRDFKLAGVALSEDKKVRYGEIKKKLSELTSKFSDNVLDATMAWSKLITDETELAGLPDSALAGAKQLAEAKGHSEGWLLNLDFPSYMPVMTYADNRELREEVYTAFATRASDQGPDAGKFDNTDNINDILKLRHELAQLLDFDNYAEYSLATKMADSTDKVIEFLEDLAKKSKPQAEKELAELKAFANAEHGAEDLQAWDVGYYGEKLRQQRYAISQEELRPWFPAEIAVDGMFSVVNRLYGISFEQDESVETWHKDVRFFNVKKGSEVIGRFYLDLFAREHKRGGAWMDECRVRRKIGDKLQLPVAYLTCNFTPPVGDKPALLTHDEVVTLFHEFGHGLHHMLTRVDYAAVSGINGVAWDAVELPSQFMENWCWEEEGLALISGHFETGDPLPKDKLDKLLAAKNFQSAMMMVRQLEFSLFDFKLHKNQAEGKSVQEVLDAVRKQVSVIMPPAFNRFQNGFSHIFAGGYAAGYYSYKWAEVLSADAFSKFEEEGIFNAETGQSFLQEILEKGGSAEPMELFVNFRGREPQVDALLRHCGIN
ncbi:oligopeptidase A [Endozoicomonas sp. OPT23]|uniref:oligopeptidase A n=1 Tax=Endozoicomonas sp. OPT23 TaxID=2072845 RepID=UPI00129AAD8D|nr:oligopeptidase A [Endozoicomonas sp. OPT23]MRI33349.1 oligopeptidase A [Endozoicomonas sp. OPT23]